MVTFTYSANYITATISVSSDGRICGADEIIAASSNAATTARLILRAATRRGLELRGV